MTFAVELTATALVAVAPLANTEVRGQVLEKGLKDATEKLASLLEVPTIGDSEHRAALYDVLGNALVTLGERESGTERLEQAVQAYRAALEVRTRERVPLDWATTQNNLGTALARLGRESGTERLEQAAQTYRAALEVRTRERVPLDWAATQTNLGNTLVRLGERESGTERLEQAAQTYRAALEVRTRERVPLDWAATQNNLGVALAILGERESGTARLKQAAQAYRAALEVFTVEDLPRYHNFAQYDLENTLLRMQARRAETGPVAAPN